MSKVVPCERRMPGERDVIHPPPPPTPRPHPLTTQTPDRILSRYRLCRYRAHGIKHSRQYNSCVHGAHMDICTDLLKTVGSTGTLKLQNGHRNHKTIAMCLSKSDCVQSWWGCLFSATGASLRRPNIYRHLWPSAQSVRLRALPGALCN